MTVLIKFIVQLLWDAVRFVVLACRPRRALVAENLFLRRKAGVAQRKRVQAAARRCRDAGERGFLIQTVRWALGAGDRAAGDFDSVASCRIPRILALEVVPS